MAEDVGKGIVVSSDNKLHLVVPVGIKVLGKASHPPGNLLDDHTGLHPLFQG